MKETKKQMSVMKKMLIALIGGVAVGVLFLVLREYLISNEKDEIWLAINNVLFQDITETKGMHAIGVFYIIGQLFMQGLQLAIVPLVLVSLSLAICSTENMKKLGRIAGKTMLCFMSFYAIAGFGGMFCLCH